MRKMSKWIILAVVILAIVGAIVFFIIAPSTPTVYTDSKELRGKTVAAISGAATGGMVERYFDGDVKLAYFNSNSDMAAALKAGKVDAYIADVYAGRLQCETYDTQTVLEDTPIQVNVVGFFYSKESERAAELCSKMNDLLREFSESGKLAELEAKWSGSEKAFIDIPLSGENGTLRFSCCSSIGKPFCFMQDNEIVGYEMEIAYLFCEKYGYDLKFVDSDYGGMLPSVASGKTDLGGTCTSITKERQEQCLFSDPSLSISFDLVVNCEAKQNAQNNIWEKISASFEHTFVTENRWKLFVSGIGSTLLITVLSIVFGTILGLGVFFLCYDGKKFANRIVNFFMWIIHGTPVIVFLMVLYYIVFGKTSWSGQFISIIAFTILFASAFIAMLRSSYRAIPHGQTEASIALGYTPFRAFTKRIFPQMASHFLETYEEEIVSLLKATSIVGYIAVQDLTKVSDIVRGRTYEAFFPLIVTTIIFFILAALLELIVQKIFRLTLSRKRTTQRILKGVTEHD